MKKRKNIIHFKGKPTSHPNSFMSLFKGVSDPIIGHDKTFGFNQKWYSLPLDVRQRVHFIEKPFNIGDPYKGAVAKATELFRWHLISLVRAKLHSDQEDI